MRFKIKFLQGFETITIIDGIRELDKDEFTIKDVETLIETEKFLERLTGLCIHIDGEM